MIPLPIDSVLPELVAALRGHSSAVLRAPTGAGKTTRVPPALLDAGFADRGRLVMLEPRRLAALGSEAIGSIVDKRLWQFTGKTQQDGRDYIAKMAKSYKPSK